MHGDRRLCWIGISLSYQQSVQLSCLVACQVLVGVFSFLLALPHFTCFDLFGVVSLSLCVVGVGS